MFVWCALLAHGDHVLRAVVCFQCSWTGDWRINATSPAQLYTAHLQNAAGNFIPSNTTYSVAGLAVPAIASPNWANVTFATSSESCLSPKGFLVSIESLISMLQ